MIFSQSLHWPRYLTRRKLSHHDIRGEIAVSQTTMVAKTGILTCHFMVLVRKRNSLLQDNSNEFDEYIIVVT